MAHVIAFVAVGPSSSVSLGNEVAVWDESAGTALYAESFARRNQANATFQCEGTEFPVQSLVLVCKCGITESVGDEFYT